MGLGVVARYSTLVEAEVACSALLGAGFHAEVMERGMATVYWTRQTALGGVRVIVPSSELQDAVSYLTVITQTWRGSRPPPRDRGWAWRLLALLAGLALMPEAGWLVISARDRAAKGSALSPWGVVVVTGALGLIDIQDSRRA
jgi:hypothetical protein